MFSGLEVSVVFDLIGNMPVSRFAVIEEKSGCVCIRFMGPAGFDAVLYDFVEFIGHRVV
jgi:hypothetical protein